MGLRVREGGCQDPRTVRAKAQKHNLQEAGPCPSPLCILCPVEGPRQKTIKRCLLNKQMNKKKNDLLAASQVLSKVILTQSYRAGVMNSRLTVQEIKFRGVMSFNCSHKAHKGWRQDLNPGPSDSRRCGFDPWSGD